MQGHTGDTSVVPKAPIKRQENLALLLGKVFQRMEVLQHSRAIGIIVSHSSDHRLRECLLKMYYGHGKSDPCIMTAIVANPSRIISKPPCSQYFRGLYSQVHTVAVTPSSILYKADAIFRYHTPLRSPSPASKASEARTSLLPDHYWSFAGSKTCLD